MRVHNIFEVNRQARHAGICASREAWPHGDAASVYTDHPVNGCPNEQQSHTINTCSNGQESESFAPLADCATVGDVACNVGLIVGEQSSESRTKPPFSENNISCEAGKDIPLETGERNPPEGAHLVRWLSSEEYVRNPHGILASIEHAITTDARTCSYGDVTEALAILSDDRRNVIKTVPLSQQSHRIIEAMHELLNWQSLQPQLFPDEAP